MAAGIYLSQFNVIGLEKRMDGTDATTFLSGDRISGGSGPPVGIGQADNIYFDHDAGVLYVSNGAAWFYFTGTEYVPTPGTPGAFWFDDADQSGHIGLL